MKSPVRKLSIALALIVMVIIALSGATLAQTPSNSAARPKRNPPTSGGAMVAMPTDGSGFGLHTITGKPFSAEEESERSQVLADGTRVSQTTQLHLYRDSQGRTRSELVPAQLQEGHRAPLIVHIEDPVARVRYMLEIERKIAHRVALPELRQNRPQFELSQAESTDQSPPARVGRPALKPTTQSADEPVRRQISHVSLGTQSMEGVEARGLQTTTTIPEGAEGNDRPITIVCENWESRELRLMMLAKCIDPLHGDNTRRVVSLDRSEPDASLFQVPPDFTIEEQQTRVVPESATGPER